MKMEFVDEAELQKAVDEPEDEVRGRCACVYPGSARCLRCSAAAVATAACVRSPADCRLHRWEAARPETGLR